MALDARSRKELAVILLLVPVFLFLLWKNLILPQMQRFQATREARARAVQVMQQTTDVQQKTMSRGEEIAKFTVMEWGRNPFFQPGINRVRPVEGVKAQPPPKFNLEGIVWDKDFPYAIINGEVWQIGDEIGGYRVKSITKEIVTLESNGQTIELKLFTDLW